METELEMLDKSHIQILIENFIKGGLIIGVSIAIIEIIAATTE